MESSTSATDDAKFRRGIAALQRFSQNKRKASSKMRYNPFSEVLFTRKRIGIEEKSLSDLLFNQSSRNDENENTSHHHQSSSLTTTTTTTTTATASSPPPSTITSDDKILFDVVQYTHLRSGLTLPPVLERCEVAAATIDDLRVAKVGEIDNTGSFHWPAEDILAHLLLVAGSGDSSSSSETVFQNNGTGGVFELGAGVGLAGLFYYYFHHHHHHQQQQTRTSSSQQQERQSQNESDKTSSKGENDFVECASSSSSSTRSLLTVVLTDGNPRVSHILEANCKVLKHHHHHHHQQQRQQQDSENETSYQNLFSLCLPWQIFRQQQQHQPPAPDTVDGDRHHVETLMSSCQYLVGADCLFFEAFHDDLVHLVLRFFNLHLLLLLRSREDRSDEKSSSSSPKVVFVAPGRGGSRQRFLGKLELQLKKEKNELESLLRWRIHEDNYDEQIYAIHLRELETRETSGYDPDRHYPQVVEIFLNKW